MLLWGRSPPLPAVPRPAPLWRGTTAVFTFGRQTGSLRGRPCLFSCPIPSPEQTAPYLRSAALAAAAFPSPIVERGALACRESRRDGAAPPHHSPTPQPLPLTTLTPLPAPAENAHARLRNEAKSPELMKRSQDARHIPHTMYVIMPKEPRVAHLVARR